MKLVRKKFGDKVVWLGKKRTPSENRPVCMMHKIREFLEKAELEQEGDPRKVEKYPPACTVKVDGVIVGYPRDGSWCWCSRAADKLNQDVMDMAKAFAKSQ